MATLDQESLESRIRLHRQFWERKSQKHPIISFRLGDFFFSRHFKASESLNIEGMIIGPEMLIVDTFLSDYERMYQESLALKQSAFWTAEPFTGIPWMEAILGCPVIAGTDSFTAMINPDFNPLDLESIRLDEENPWLLKYLEFTDRLVALSGGRFPVGQPIMRGPSDIIGALIGQVEMIYLINDDPESFSRLVHRVTQIFLEVIRLQKARIPPFHNGSSIGFYHLWTPGSCVWYQDDLSSILSPELYSRFFIDAGKQICASYDRSVFHLHPSSFIILDELLNIDDLDVIEVNKDIGGPSVAEMLPVLQKIMETKRLILWGDLTAEDLDLLRAELPVKGLFLNIVTQESSRIEVLQDRIANW